jgi:hypothetical protein
MDKNKVREIMNQLFAGEDIDAAVEKIYPLMNKKRLQGILDGTQDFSKADVMLITSAFVQGTPPGPMVIDPKVQAVIDDLRKEIGDVKNILKH